ncbi:MAG: hypothetical protein EON61_18670 [Alphaproteobacteria bacterium]|nr:MAG: hypothetical protein EON61_18670 [Alphaproteobacteria bacterium]
MIPRALSAAAILLALSACTPKDEELDGAPKGDSSELAGGPPARQTVLPGVLDLTAPTGAEIVPACEKIVAPDYDQPPAMTCLLFLVDEPAASAQAGETDSGFNRAMKSSGWGFIRATGAERYYERPKAGTDCADLAVVSILEGPPLAGIIAAAKAPEAPLNSAWQAYAISATTRETCGADRMKPE